MIKAKLSELQFYMMKPSDAMKKFRGINGLGYSSRQDMFFRRTGIPSSLPTDDCYAYNPEILGDTDGQMWVFLLKPGAVIPDGFPATKMEFRLNGKLDDLGDNIVQLAAGFPNHPMVKGTILAKFNKFPEQAFNSMKELQDWIEANCKLDPELTISFLEYLDPSGVKEEKKVDTTPVITATLKVTETEWGRCDYRRTLVGTDTRGLTRTELVKIRDACIGDGDDYNGFIEEVYRTMREEIQENLPAMESSEEETSNHEAADSDGTEVSFAGGGGLRRQLLDWLRQNSDEEEKDLLGL